MSPLRYQVAVRLQGRSANIILGCDPSRGIEASRRRRYPLGGSRHQLQGLLWGLGNPHDGRGFAEKEELDHG